MPKQPKKIRLADTDAGACLPHLRLSKQNQVQSNCFTQPQIIGGNWGNILKSFTILSLLRSHFGLFNFPDYSNLPPVTGSLLAEQIINGCWKINFKEIT